MATIEFLSSEQASHWHQWLAKAGCEDVYFSPEYARTFDTIEGGTPHLFLYSEQDNWFLYPFRLRRLSEIAQFAPFGDWSDMTSDYGYGGPVVYTSAQKEQDVFMNKAVQAFDEFCAKKRVVSEFCRFHPLFDNARYMKTAYQPIFCNQTVWIDLTLPEEKLWKQIRKGYRYDIRKSEKQGVEVESCEVQDGIDQFYELYTTTMQDVGANHYYFFPKEFFQTTLQLLANYTMIFFAMYEGKTIAAAFYIWGKEWMHYYFAAMDRTYSHIGANKLLQYRAILWGKHQGFRKLHLGGGVGGSDSDALMFFKAGFSGLRADFYIAKRIHHHEMYRALCKAVQVDPATESFFPAYRAIFRKRGINIDRNDI